MAKTAAEQLQANKKPKRVVLDKDFAGIKAGSTLFVATPQLVDQYIRSIPPGEQRSVAVMRDELAHQRSADATCPASSAIFLRIAAQAAIDEIEAGKSPLEVTPFWRLIDSRDKVAKKLTIDPLWIDAQRAREGIAASG